MEALERKFQKFLFETLIRSGSCNLKIWHLYILRFINFTIDPYLGTRSESDRLTSDSLSQMFGHEFN